MARHPGPRPPRAAAPDLPGRFDEVSGLAPRTEVFAARLTGLSGDVAAAHTRLVETTAEEVSADRLDLTGATLVDVRLGIARLVELVGRDGSWRNVVVAGGRISTLDLQRATLDGVEFVGVRIDYLGASAATLQDVRFSDCGFGSVDLPGATTTRVAFDGCRVDEFDTRDLRATDLDLRGLDALAFTDVRALRGATLTPTQLTLHAPSFAAALGVDVRD